MALSWEETSGTAGQTTVAINIAYLDESDIHIEVNDVEVTGFTWNSPTLITLPTTTTIVAGDKIAVIRKTDRSALRLLFSEGAAFTRDNLDEQNEQFLYLAQELVEGRSIDGFYGDLSMNGYKIIELATPTESTDAANKSYVDSTVGTALDTALENTADEIANTVRTKGVALNAITGDLANKIIAFDSTGQPYPAELATGSAQDVLNKLAGINGATYVGTSSGKTVQASLDKVYADFSNTSDASLGDNLIGVKQPYSGAVATTQHQKNMQTVTFAEFGAVGDGVTDDSAAILAALNSGAYVEVSDGKTYLVGQALTLTNDGIELSLSKSTKLKRGFTGGGLLTLKGSDCRIIGGEWDGAFDSSKYDSGDAFIWLLGNRNLVAGIRGLNTFRGIAVSSGGVDTQEGVACDNVVIYNVLDTCDNIGVMTDHALRTRISGNLITNCGAECVTIDNESHHSIVSENSLITSGLKGSAGLIGAGNMCNYNLFYDNYLDGCKDNGGIGVNGDYNIIRGNTIINCAGAGAYVSANTTYGTPTKNTIANNNINLCTSFASVDAGCVDTVIVDNTGGDLSILDSGTGTRIYRVNSGKHGHIFKGGYTNSWALAAQTSDGKSNAGFYDTGNGYLSLSLHNASDAERMKLDPVSGAHLFGNNLTFGRAGGTDNTYPRMYAAADGTLFLEMSATYKFLWGTNGAFQMSSDGGSTWKSVTFN